MCQRGGGEGIFFFFFFFFCVCVCVCVWWIFCEVLCFVWYEILSSDV